MTKQSKLMLGPIEVTTGKEIPKRMAILLWGAATCGKTTLAATAPGDKLWLSLGDQEHVSIAHRADVHVTDLSTIPTAELFKHAQNDNPFGLDEFLSVNTNFETVVVDSATALTFRALQHSVSKGIGASNKFVPSIEAPGQSAYGGRNAIVLSVLTGLLRVTAKHGVHIIITAHEADPTQRIQDGKEIIDYISIMLGGQLVNNMSWRLSEIWYMSQEPYGEHRRKIAIRPTRLRRPMKTRMFTSKGEAEFVLEYDADMPDAGQMTISGWYDNWCAVNGAKILLPTGKIVRVSQTKGKV